MTRLSRSASLAAALSALAALAAAAPAAAQAPPAPGLTIDTRFAPPSGIGKFDFTTGTAADVTGGLAIHNDRIYTVGETRDSTGDADIGIVARKPDGTLDDQFSGDGLQKIAIAQNVGTNKGRDAGFGVVALPDGRLRIAAAVDVDTGAAVNLDVALVGVMPDGSLDPSFGDGGDGSIVFKVNPATGNDTPTRMALDPVTGRIAVVGTTVADGKDNFFVTLREPDGSPAAFGTGGLVTFNRGGVAGGNVSLNDRGTDVAFRPGGGIVAFLQVETNPDANLNDWHAVLHAFRDDGSDETAFAGTGDLVVGVGSPDTIPGGMLVHGDQLWLTGSTKAGQDTDAFLARLNLDGSGLESRRFDMRGNAVNRDTAVTSQGNDLAVVPGIPATLVVGGFMTGDAGTDWAAAAFNDLTAGVGNFGVDDTVFATPGQGTIVSVVAGSGQWAAVGGSLLDLNSADTSFGTSRVLVDADKECDLQLEVTRPLELAFRANDPASMDFTVTNRGTRACGGSLSAAAPYALRLGDTAAPLPVPVLAAGAATTLSAAELRFTGPRRRTDTVAFALDAPGDVNPDNNVRTLRVAFRFCDLTLSAEGGRAIAADGAGRFPVEVRNAGTAPCRQVRVGVAAGGETAGSGERFTLAAGRSASTSVAALAGPKAKAGTRLRLVLGASSPDDVDRANDTAVARPFVVRAGDSSIRAAGSRLVRGSASGGSGKPLEGSARRVRRVEIAIQRVVGKRCASLASRSGSRFTGRRACGRRIWLRAEGTRSWRLRLDKALPPGTYVVASRASIGAGLTEARFSTADRNTRTFTVR